MRARGWRSPAPAVLVLLLADGVILAAMELIMSPPLQDLLNLGLFLFVSGAFALALGCLAPALARRGAIRSVRWQIIMIPVLVVSLTVANLGFIGHLMFVSAHDLALLTLVLLFSLVMAVVLSLVLSESLGVSIRNLGQAMHAVSSGEMRTRAEAISEDELGSLAKAFNAMAEQLEMAFTKQRELEQTRREMVVAVSHDLRTPLSSMRAMAESINDGVVDDPAVVKDYLKTMETEVARLSTLIDDLFELSQIDAGALELHVEPASLRDLMSDTLESMRPQATQRGLALEGDAAEDLPEVSLDPARMQRVLSNLVQNAIIHTDPGGTVSIHAKATDAVVEVAVNDTGHGISPEDLPRIFDPFYRGDPARGRRDGGSGLGLSIVKALVEAHGGTVSASSEPGQGSTFTFTLPLRIP